MNLEKVYTVTAYYDGPRGGVANYKGKPHVYECLFDYFDDKELNGFRLLKISEETLMLELEDWNIWLEWRDKVNKTEEESKSHPALPKDNLRHQELKKELEIRLQIDPSNSFIADGTFYGGDKEEYEVIWEKRN